MEKRMSRMQIILLVLCWVAIAGCGKKQDEAEQPAPPAAQASQASAPVSVPNMENQEQAREYIQQQMQRMEDRVSVMDAQAAYALALPEAKKWDAQAKLYQFKGEKKLTPEGTAAMWTGYFATQIDGRNTPRAEQGKKLTVLMMDGRVVKVSPKETPEDIKFSAPCHAFLPENRLNSKEALAKCLAVLKKEHGAAADNAELTRLICTSQSGSGSEYQPVWELNASVDGSSASATIHAVTGEMLEAM